MKTLYKFSLLLFSITLLSACEKGWLEEKRNISTIIPTTLRDMRLLMNNELTIMKDTRALSEMSSDDFYTTDAIYNALTTRTEVNAIIWNPEIYEGSQTVVDWNTAYEQVLITNVVLDGLQKINPNTSDLIEYNDLKGGALFHRSRAFFNLVQSFAKQYNPSTASTDPGIPLKLSPDVNEPVKRATVKQCYDKIILDLKEAVTLLKEVPLYKTDGSKPAANGLLARCYLSMGDYDNALEYANRYLQSQNQLMDFNTITSTGTYPVPLFNIETAFAGSISANHTTFSVNSGRVNMELVNLYHSDDLRKTVFLLRSADGTYGFRGSYLAASTLFTGIATDEIYLIKAEALARKGNTAEALKTINDLVRTRFKTGTFIPYTASSTDDAIQIILNERRKELLRRGLRWADLKRLNMEPKLARTLTKSFNGQTYTLLPNDPRYVFPIPEYVINFAGIEQNPR